jgi:hypothetical protein
MRTIRVFLVASAFATAAAAGPLDVVTVGAPAINCKFDTDCTITVSDTTANIALPGATGSGFLQSRTFPPGEPGTAAAGLFGYEYRIDLRNLVGVTAAPCVSQLRLDFGPVSLVDYDGDGNTDQVFVVTSGDGARRPVSAQSREAIQRRAAAVYESLAGRVWRAQPLLWTSEVAISGPHRALISLISRHLGAPRPAGDADL